MNVPLIYDITPFSFNAIKHHLTFARRVSLDHRSQGSDLQNLLKRVGDSQMDLYTGKLGISEIIMQTKDQLIAHKHFDRSAFEQWIDEGFQIIKLSDGSSWVLRRNYEGADYIHIHPARYSLHSSRIKANTWKTAVLVFCYYQDIGKFNPSIQSARAELGLSPLKNISRRSGCGFWLMQLLEL